MDSREKRNRGIDIAAKKWYNIFTSFEEVGGSAERFFSGGGYYVFTDCGVPNFGSSTET